MLYDSYTNPIKIINILLGSVYIRAIFNLFYTLLSSVDLRVIFLSILYTLLRSLYLRVYFYLFYTLLGSVYLKIYFKSLLYPFG